MAQYDSYNSQDIKVHNREVRGAYLKDLIPIPFDPILDPEFGTCFNCWESGHTFQKCQVPKMCDFCHNCGRIGEKVHSCPRCHQAYRKYWADRNQSIVEHYPGDVKFHEDPIKEKSNVISELKLDETSIHQSSNIETDDEYFSFEDEEESYDNFIVDADEKLSNIETDDKYFSCEDEEESYDNFIVDEDEKSSNIRPKNPSPSQKGYRNSRPMPLKTRGVYANVKLQPVPFDPAVDCPPYACFNCRVLDEHLSRDCTKPGTHQYCINCGRRGLQVFDCPRCSKGYLEEFFPSHSLRQAEQTAVGVPNKVERKLPVGMTSPVKPVKKANSSSSSSPQVSPDKNPVMNVQMSTAKSESAVGSETKDESLYEDDDEDLEQIIFDEDLDDIVVDEDEMPAVEPRTDNAALAFISLVEMMKHLPIETQNMVVMQFAEHQKVLAELS